MHIVGHSKFQFWGCLFAGLVLLFLWIHPSKSLLKQNLSDGLLGSGSCWHLRVGDDNLCNAQCIKSQKPLILTKAKRLAACFVVAAVKC
ncbi:hypothetical protein VNO80_08560 [Phaseolus coccineus]|uniref:Uncharacterized protein n=1 Tax=Phaseolus coccineus TaxID=3886 RepID=A0AAN9N545_PHACN